MHAHQVGDGRNQPEIDPHGAHHKNPSVAVAAEQRCRSGLEQVGARWNRLDELGQRHPCQERILHDEVTKPPLPSQTIHRMGNGTRRAMRTHLGNSIVKCISRVTPGVQQGPGFTVESPDTRFENGAVGAVQDSSDLESCQLATHESVLADDLEPFVDQHRFEMRNVVGSGQGGRDGLGFGLYHRVANRLPHPELGGEHGGAPRMDRCVMIDDQRRGLGGMPVKPHEHPAERSEVVAHRDDPGLLLGTDRDPERRSGRSRRRADVEALPQQRNGASPLELSPTISVERHGGSALVALGGGLVGSRSVGLLAAAVALLEALDATGGVDDLHLAGEEGVTLA